MNSSRRLTGLVYGLGVLIVLLGLGGVTNLALQLERREYEAAAERQFDETVQLALWQMESTLLPIINSEVGTPYFFYRSFYPAEGAYTRMWEEVPPDAVLVESPLLTAPAPFVLLHFEIGPDGSFSSPQVPTGNMRDQAEAGKPAMSERIIASEVRLATLQSFLAPASKDQSARYAFDDLEAFFASVEEAELPLEQSVDGLADELGQSDALDEDFEARQELLRFAQQSNVNQRAAQQVESESERAKTADLGRAAADLRKSSEGLAAPAASSLPRPREVALITGEAAEMGEPNASNGPMIGLFRLVWRTGPAETGGQLVMLRSVDVQGARTVQGVWLDWPGVESALLRAAVRLLPDASLRPVYAGSQPNATGQRLASVPAMLDPGPMDPFRIPFVTPTRAAVGVSWLAILAAVGAIGLVLRKSTDLAERRGQFVTAVTHELRTPLTTFCLYTQMLADGMVREDTDRQHYLVTLKRESRRLAGIVENVLDYARLGQRQKANSCDVVLVEALFERIEPSLVERADASGMTLSIEPIPEGATVIGEGTTIERILVNLVDNACKYADEGDEKRIDISTRMSSKRCEICVRDFGLGVPTAESERIFQPFHRAKTHAQSPNPGLGLGLALARGLAREMGGDLILGEAESGIGAVFCLRLLTRDEPTKTP